MISESASGSLKEQLSNDCLMDSVGSEDVDDEHIVDTIVSDADDSNVVRSMRSDADDTKGHSIMSNDVHGTSVVRSVHSGEEKNQSLLSNASSNDSNESGVASLLSYMYGNSEDGLDEYCQMNCMDFMFLPKGAKQKPDSSKQMFTVNKEGAKELNIEVKGALAMGFQERGFNAELKNDDAKPSMSFRSKFKDTMSCGNSVLMKGLNAPYSNKDAGKDDYMSIMSFSHDSSEEDGHESTPEKNNESPEEGGDKSMVFKTQALPQPGVQTDLLQKQIQHQVQEQIKIQQQEEEDEQKVLEQQLQEQRRLLQQHHLQEEQFRQQRFQQQQQQQNYQQLMGYHQQPYQSQGYHPIYHRPMNQHQQMGLDILNAPPTDHRFANTMRRVPTQQPLPNQIPVGGQETFEESSVSSHEANYQANVAPNPPQSSLERIVEAENSDDESDSSMVACGSMDENSVKENPSADSEEEKPSADSVKENSISGSVREKHSFGSVHSNPSFGVKSNPSFGAPKMMPKKEEKTPNLDLWKNRNNQSLQTNKNRTNVNREENSDDSDQASQSSETTAPVRNGDESKKEIKKHSPKPKSESGELSTADSIFARRLANRRATRLRNYYAAERATTFASERVEEFTAPLDKKKSEAKPFDFTPKLSETNLKNTVENDYTVSGNLSDSSDLIPSPPTEPSHDPSIMEVVAAAAALALNPDFKLMPELDFESEKTESEDAENEDEFVPMPELDFEEEEDTENQAPPPPIVKSKDGKNGTKVSKSATGDFDTLSKKIRSEEVDQEESKPANSPLKIQTKIDDDDVLEPLVLSPINEGNTPKGNPLSPLRMARIPSPRRFARNRIVQMSPSPRNAARPLSSGTYYNQWLGGMHIMSPPH